MPISFFILPQARRTTSTRPVRRSSRSWWKRRSALRQFFSTYQNTTPMTTNRNSERLSGASSHFSNNSESSRRSREYSAGLRASRPLRRRASCALEAGAAAQDWPLRGPFPGPRTRTRRTPTRALPELPARPTRRFRRCETHRRPQSHPQPPLVVDARDPHRRWAGFHDLPSPRHTGPHRMDHELGDCESLA